jgi:signal recognition particle subunit SEC65
VDKYQEFIDEDKNERDFVLIDQYEEFIESQTKKESDSHRSQEPTSQFPRNNSTANQYGIGHGSKTPENARGPGAGRKIGADRWAKSISPVRGRNIAQPQQKKSPKSKLTNEKVNELQFESISEESEPKDSYYIESNRKEFKTMINVTNNTNDPGTKSQLTKNIHTSLNFTSRKLSGEDLYNSYS